MKRNTKITTISSALVALLVVLPSASHAQLKIYVGINGNDKYDGLSDKVNSKLKTGPKRNIEAARDEIRKRKQANTLGSNGAEVIILPGIYRLTKGLEFNTVDGGTESAPIIYRATQPNKVFIDGGRQLGSWRRLDKAVANTLRPEVKDKLYVASLRALNTKNVRLARRGAGLDTNATPPDLYFDNDRMPISRYPNVGWLTVPANPSGSATDVPVTDAKAFKWRKDNDVWLYGYLGFDWADLYESVTLDPVASKAKLLNQSYYGIKPGQRYRFVNVLDEIDEPGEWSLNPKSQAVYFYPPAASFTRRTNIAVVEAPLIKTNSVSNIRFENLTFQFGRRQAIQVDNGANVVVRGCTVRSMGTDGIVLRNGDSCVIDSCDLYELGETGIVLHGGDRLTLTSGNNVAINNNVRRYGQVCRTYRPAIQMSGCGNLATNNRLEDAPHLAVGIQGNNQLFEKNEIARVCQDTDDAGALYVGRNVTFRGNIVRQNLFQDIVATSVGGTRRSVVAVYLDDCASGTKVESNIFRRCNIGVLIGGGRDNTVKNNVFDSNDLNLQADARMAVKPSLWEQWGIGAMLAEVRANQAPYSTTYPHMGNLESDEKYLPKYNVIRENISVGSTQMFNLRDNTGTLVGGDGSLLFTRTNNLETADPGFVNLGVNDLRVLPGSPAEAIGFQAFDTSVIGLQVNTYRASVPALAGSSNRTGP